LVLGLADQLRGGHTGKKKAKSSAAVLVLARFKGNNTRRPRPLFSVFFLRVSVLVWH
jgi:hypothetical protein